MEISSEQYSKIEGYFPTQRGNVKNDNLKVLNAILYVAEHGCKLQMERITKAIRQLAHDLHSYEPMGEERGSKPNLRGFTAVTGPTGTNINDLRILLVGE